MLISSEDAEPFLTNLDGDVVPETWRGNLPLTYHVGPRTYVTILDAT
jgi:N-acetylated-alpha-linked acidic dipeptidase